MRAVIYARYSTDLQSASSIDDQVRLCRERLERDGHDLVQVYSDRAVSVEPPLFEEFVREFTAEVNRQRSQAAKEKGSLQEELTRVSKQIDRLVEAIMQGADALALNAKLKTLEEQKAILENKLKLAPAPEPLLHPALATIYRNKVERLIPQ